MFAPALGATGEDIAVRRLDLGEDTDGDPILAAFPKPGPPLLQADGHINGGTLFITTNEDVLFGDIGYRKVALHEIGHALGLAHTGRHDGKSVMNVLGMIRGGNVFQKRDDYRWV